MSEEDAGSTILNPDLSSYSGRWVALLNGQVIGHGGTPEQALHAARNARYKETPQLVFVPMKEKLIFHPILEKITTLLPLDIDVYLVGGAVRDALLQRLSNDLDFVVTGDSLEVARKLADKIGGSYFPLDEERDTARIVLIESKTERTYIDFTAMRGKNLESDLRGRDFTINAMAVNIRDPQKIIDPLNGGVDLLSHRLRACTPTAIQDDPVRILRAIRIAGDFELKITPDTLSMMRSGLVNLSNVSAERKSAELFRIFSNARPGRAIRALDVLGAIPYILPELTALKGVGQSAPHTADVWEHSLDVVNHLEDILEVLSGDYDPDKAANLNAGMMVTRLGRYRQQISEYINASLNVNRKLRSLLFFAALYHDVGKPETKLVGDDGRIHFYSHDKEGSRIAAQQARSLRLSNHEVERISTIIRNHLRPILLARLDDPPSRRAIYRFFRDTGPAGVDICLLSLADTLATHGITISPEVWQRQIDVTRILLEAWWEHPQEYIMLPTLISGKDLVEKFDLAPGPIIGELLEMAREAQAMGLIHTPQESLKYVEQILNEKDKKGLPDTSVQEDRGDPGL